MVVRDLTPPLAARLRRMVGFRNIAVHEYEEVDPAIVERKRPELC